MIAKNLPEWHKAVCERDRYVCQLQISPQCKRDYSEEGFFENGKNQFVCGDHVLTQGAHPELRLDTRYGKCVCFYCHTLKHKGYEVPSSYLLPVEDPAIRYTHIDNKRRPMSSGEKMCKCGKFIALKISGLCMRCEKRPIPNFKSPKKNKNDDKKRS